MGAASFDDALGRDADGALLCLPPGSDEWVDLGVVHADGDTFLVIGPALRKVEQPG
jgi:hypothetical protein